MTPRTRVRAALGARSLLALAPLLAAGTALAAPADPSGTWLTEDGRARIRIEKCGATQENLCGYVVWLKVPLNDEGKPRIDFKNPDAKKRERPSLGHQLIMGLKPNADDRYEGQIYNSEDGKKYDVTIWLEDQASLSVKGCLIAFLCKTQTWNRKTDVASGQLPGPTGGPNGPTPDPEWASRTAAAPAARRPTPAAAPTR